jgi:diguanylate cyclase (GGDEF)-like protein
MSGTPTFLVSPGHPPLPPEDRARITRVVEERLITPFFQPIVDLHTGGLLGYEVLSRGPAEMTAPAQLFDAAKRGGLSWELDRACRQAAIAAISSFGPPARDRAYFLNVSPDMFVDPRFTDDFTLAELRAKGLDPRSVVIEITERESIADGRAFEAQVRQYVQQGFQIALDDFGAGHSGLVTLVSCAPHFLKLDAEISQGCHLHHYKQLLIRSLVAFADSVEARIIAEGIERWEELEALVRLGVRYGQGYLLGRPAPSPFELDGDMLGRLKRVARRYSYRESDLGETIAPMVTRCRTVESLAMQGRDIEQLFRRAPALDHLVVVDGGERPLGLITRHAYYTRAAGPVGYQLYQNRFAREIANRDALSVEDRMPVTALAKLAMERGRDELYDPVIVTTPGGDLVGTITMRQLIMRALELEVRAAQGASPLTGLPGNRAIERWMRDAAGGGCGTVVYADLDHFKEYNDRYGFVAGDEMIRVLADVLGAQLPALASDASLGHVGGDDFVAVAPGAVAEPALAVVPMERAAPENHPGELGQLAASLKRKVKELTAECGRSAYLIERRHPTR